MPSAGSEAFPALGNVGRDHVKWLMRGSGIQGAKRRGKPWSRNVRAFMSLFECSKPVVCKVHGFCVAGRTDLALCSDLLVIEDTAKIGYPPARMWGSPTTSVWMHRLGPHRAKRLLFTGDCLSGAEALEWGLAIEAPAAAELDDRTESLVARIGQTPVNQLQMMKPYAARLTAGGAVLETWLADTSPDPLSDTARSLAYLDAQGGRPGDFAGRRRDRNVRLYVRG